MITHPRKVYLLQELKETLELMRDIVTVGKGVVGERHAALKELGAMCLELKAKINSYG